MIPRVRAAAGVLALSALLLAACSATPSAQPTVPTLSTPGSASTTATSGGADAGRPRERIDMTNDEVNALYEAYNQCLISHGYDKRRNPTDQAAATKAQAACVSKDPLPPWELDVSNPHSEDFVHAVVQCLRAKGVKYVSEEPPANGRATFSFGGPGNDPGSITLGMQDTPACEKQVAAQGIGN